MNNKLRAATAIAANKSTKTAFILAEIISFLFSSCNFRKIFALSSASASLIGVLAENSP